MTIHLGGLLPNRSSNLPAGRWENRSPAYVVLHRVGFALPPTITGGAVRSYRTFEPLPAAETTGCLFSVALSLRLLWAGVTRHPFPMVPGLSSARLTARRGHPARLEIKEYRNKE